MTVPTTEIRSVVLTADEVGALPLVDLDGISGVRHRVLWSRGASMAGVLEVAPGAHLGEHAHRVNHHHIWVVGGSADILGRRLAAGGYAHVASGVVHDIDARRTDGCTVFYLYEPPAG